MASCKSGEVPTDLREGKRGSTKNACVILAFTPFAERPSNYSEHQSGLHHSAVRLPTTALAHIGRGKARVSSGFREHPLPQRLELRLRGSYAGNSAQSGRMGGSSRRSFRTGTVYYNDFRGQRRPIEASEGFSECDRSPPVRPPVERRAHRRFPLYEPHDDHFERRGRHSRRALVRLQQPRGLGTVFQPGSRQFVCTRPHRL